MARDMDRKLPVKIVAPFLCPKCGRTFDLVVSKQRVNCPECSRKKQIEDARERYRRDKESIRIKNEALKKIDAQKEKVDKVLGLEQCRKCHWYRGSSGEIDYCCHYYLLHGVGHRRDPGNGPGDCRSFEPKRRRSRKSIIDNSRRLLEMIEKDNHAQLPRKGERPNG